MSAEYDALDQPYRIQKRLVLNRCFRTLRDAATFDRVTYVTFGGRDLYDVMDFVSVFDVTRHELNVVSYEQRADVAAYSQSCPVATALSKIQTVRIEIVPTSFPEDVDPLHELRATTRFVYFLDYTATFAERHGRSITELLAARLLRAGDFVMVTSCLSPRIVHQGQFMSKHLSAFQLFYGPKANICQEFKVRNHVDLLVGLAVARSESNRTLPERANIAARLLQKFKYKDSKAPMGLWLYEMALTKERGTLLRDQPFQEFPYAFIKTRFEAEDVPNIFD